uniref:Collagen alpha-1(I) chain-like n=1 Tax=Tursiops truncatus TaxID=9739 RepID=A0A6J3QGI1_TURTR|nr:collagen alpha-1(I) chain-like [Tursiops truncatus]
MGPSLAATQLSPSAPLGSCGPRSRVRPPQPPGTRPETCSTPPGPRARAGRWVERLERRESPGPGFQPGPRAPGPLFPFRWENGGTDCPKAAPKISKPRGSQGKAYGERPDRHRDFSQAESWGSGVDKRGYEGLGARCPDSFPGGWTELDHRDGPQPHEINEEDAFLSSVEE